MDFFTFCFIRHSNSSVKRILFLIPSLSLPFSYFISLVCVLLHSFSFPFLLLSPLIPSVSLSFSLPPHCHPCMTNLARLTVEFILRTTTKCQHFESLYRHQVIILFASQLTITMKRNLCYLCFFNKIFRIYLFSDVTNTAAGKCFYSSDSFVCQVSFNYYYYCVPQHMSRLSKNLLFSTLSNFLLMTQKIVMRKVFNFILHRGK